MYWKTCFVQDGVFLSGYGGLRNFELKDFRNRTISTGNALRRQGDNGVLGGNRTNCLTQNNLDSRGRDEVGLSQNPTAHPRRCMKKRMLMIRHGKGSTGCTARVPCFQLTKLITHSPLK